MTKRFSSCEWQPAKNPSLDERACWPHTAKSNEFRSGLEEGRGQISQPEISKDCLAELTVGDYGPYCPVCDPTYL